MSEQRAVRTDLVDSDGVPLATIRRGDPEPSEPAHEAVERILQGGIEALARESEAHPFEFRVHDGPQEYKVLANARGRGVMCLCPLAITTGGACVHVKAIKAWFFRRRFPEPPPPGPGEPPRAPRPFAIWEGD